MLFLNFLFFTQDTILSNPNLYTETFLGRPVYEYCAWIQDDRSWGGEIELSILSAHFKVEVLVFDVISMSRLCYGEDQGFTQRLFLLYDGIHYDAIAEAQSSSASSKNDKTLFAINDFVKVVYLCICVLQFMWVILQSHFDQVENASVLAVEAHQVRC